MYVCGEQLKRLSRRWQRSEEALDESVKRKIEQISNEFAKDLLESTRSTESDRKRSARAGTTDADDKFNPNIAIAKALATNRFPRKVMKKVKKYQVSSFKSLIFR